MKHDKDRVFVLVDGSPILEIYVDAVKRVDGGGDVHVDKPPRWKHTPLLNTYCPPVATNFTSASGSIQVSTFAPIKPIVHLRINEEGIPPSFFNKNNL